MIESIENPMNLPAVAFETTDLKQLQKKFEELLHLPDIRITISREGTEHTYESFDSMLSDKLSPSVIRSFEIQFKSAGGRGRITANSNKNDKHLLYIDGHNEWCKHVYAEVVDFMTKREIMIRSKLSGKYRITPISAISTILVGQMFTTLSPFGVFYPSSSQIPTIQFYLLIFSMIFFASTFRQYFYPYVYWTTEDREITSLYKKSTAEIIGLSVLLVTSAHVINYLFGGSVPF